jgi:hypothetical protein
MSLHINRFLDRILAAESRQQRDVTMTVQDARALHTELTRLLLIAEELRTHAVADENVKIEIKGGDF